MDILCYSLYDDDNDDDGIMKLLVVDILPGLFWVSVCRDDIHTLGHLWLWVKDEGSAVFATSSHFHWFSQRFFFHIGLELSANNIILSFLYNGLLA